MRLTLPLDRDELLALDKLIWKGFEELTESEITGEVRLALSVWHGLIHPIKPDRRKYLRIEPKRDPLEAWVDNNLRNR